MHHLTIFQVLRIVVIIKQKILVCSTLDTEGQITPYEYTKYDG